MEREQDFGGTIPLLSVPSNIPLKPFLSAGADDPAFFAFGTFATFGDFEAAAFSAEATVDEDADFLSLSEDSDPVNDLGGSKKESMQPQVRSK